MTTYNMKNFKNIGQKPGGQLYGGIYKKISGKDQQSNWVIKFHNVQGPLTQYTSIGDAMDEYIASKLYNHFLPNQTPKMVLIKDDFYLKENYAITGSKLLENYQNLAYYKIYYDKIPANLNNKPVLDKEKVIFISDFLCEQDLKESNIGLIENDKGYSFARIDFDHSLRCFKYNQKAFQINNDIMCALAKEVTNTSFSELAEIIDASYNEFNKYFGKYSYQFPIGTPEGTKSNEYIKDMIAVRYKSLQESMKDCKFQDDNEAIESSLHSLAELSQENLGKCNAEIDELII